MNTIIALLALLAPLLSYAADTASYFTLTYQSQVGTSVVTTSTVFTLAPSTTASGACSSATPVRRSVKWPRLAEGNSHDHGHDHAHNKRATPTFYTYDPAVLAYPTFSSVPLSVATSPAAPGLQNVTDFAREALQLILLLKKASDANCDTCKTVFHELKQTMEVRQETLSIIAEPFCASFTAFLPLNVCVGLLKIASTDMGGILPQMNMQGKDGQTFCAFMFGVCDLPPVPKLDPNDWFHGTKKPANKVLTPSTNAPLKVMHLSDYHLDLRYIVGSEATCGGSVCCRVFPYTNTSTPIKQPANLFGNYLCDTPEALGTSVFRGVPKATGYEWCDFAFGIFTGDLVAHDLWELGKDYVVANELEAYQEFFNGMGDVPIYPTLGNHDTFPHAFTAFPRSPIKHANASYAEQQLYNYQAYSSALENYGWLSAADAQQVVTSGLGIYRTMTKEGLIIISLNSDVWYYFNFYAYIHANRLDKTGMFRILIDWLLEAEENDQAVWIIQHVNPGGSTDYEAIPAPTDLYYQITTRFNNTIRAQFFGHTHADEFSLYYANNATTQDSAHAATVAYIGPSVTPFTNRNAGFRYYLVDAENFAVIDSINYIANISNAASWAAQGDGDVVWEYEYSARETYDYMGLLKTPNEPLSPAWWHAVSEEIATNATTFQTYTDLRTKKFRPYAALTAAARNATLCGLRSMSVPIFERCLGSMESTSSYL